MLNSGALESKARTGRFLRGKLISGHGLIFSYESQQGVVNEQDSRGSFKGCLGLWVSGCLLARRLHQLMVSIAMNLGTFLLILV